MKRYEVGFTSMGTYVCEEKLDGGWMSADEVLPLIRELQTALRDVLDCGPDDSRDSREIRKNAERLVETPSETKAEPKLTPVPMYYACPKCYSHHAEGVECPTANRGAKS